MRPARCRAPKGCKGTESRPLGCPSTGKTHNPASRLGRPPGAQLNWALARSSLRRAPGRGRGSDPPEAPEESCEARGPGRRPPRAPPLTSPCRRFVLPGVASPAWAQAPEPLTPGCLGPRRPRSRASRPPLPLGCRRAPRLGTRRYSPGRRSANRAGCGRRGRSAGRGGR